LAVHDVLLLVLVVVLLAAARTAMVPGRWSPALTPVK
jgi:hypothetical protein